MQTNKSLKLKHIREQQYLKIVKDGFTVVLKNNTWVPM